MHRAAYADASRALRTPPYRSGSAGPAWSPPFLLPPSSQQPFRWPFRHLDPKPLPCRHPPGWSRREHGAGCKESGPAAARRRRAAATRRGSAPAHPVLRMAGSSSSSSDFPARLRLTRFFAANSWQRGRRDPLALRRRFPANIRAAQFPPYPPIQPSPGCGLTGSPGELQIPPSQPSRTTRSAP